MFRHCAIIKNAEKQLKAEADRVHRQDLEKLLERQRAIEEKVKGSGKLKRFGADIRLMFSMIRDYWYGDYRSVPWKTIAAVAGALLYVLNPLDFIPDLISWWNPICTDTRPGKSIRKNRSRWPARID